MKVFGCDSYAVVEDIKLWKNDARAKKYIHLGSAGDVKGCLLFDRTCNRPIVRRNVTFNELGFNNRDVNEAFCDDLVNDKYEEEYAFTRH